jgi:hypothetical protein
MMRFFLPTVWSAGRKTHRHPSTVIDPCRKNLPMPRLAKLQSGAQGAGNWWNQKAWVRGSISLMVSLTLTQTRGRSPHLSMVRSSCQAQVYRVNIDLLCMSQLERQGGGVDSSAYRRSFLMSPPRCALAYHWHDMSSGRRIVLLNSTALDYSRWVVCRKGCTRGRKGCTSGRKGYASARDTPVVSKG